MIFFLLESNTLFLLSSIHTFGPIINAHLWSKSCLSCIGKHFLLCPCKSLYRKISLFLAWCQFPSWVQIYLPYRFKQHYPLVQTVSLSLFFHPPLLVLWTKELWIPYYTIRIGRHEGPNPHWVLYIFLYFPFILSRVNLRYNTHSSKNNQNNFRWVQQMLGVLISSHCITNFLIQVSLSLVFINVFTFLQE